MVGKRRRQSSGRGKLPWLAQIKSESGGTDSPTNARQTKPKSEVGWKARTRQSEGRQTEKEIAKRRGARLHPASGALRVKNDASDKEKVYEIKDANKTYTMKGSELRDLWRNAVKQLKDPVFVVYFKEYDITVTMTIAKGKR